MRNSDVNQEWYTLGDMAKVCGCDKRTVSKVLMRLREAYDVPERVWNGTVRVHKPSFDRACLELVSITY